MAPPECRSGVAYGATKWSLQGLPDEELLQTDETFKPMDQRNVILTYAYSKQLNDKHPERNKQYSRLQKKEVWS